MFVNLHRERLLEVRCCCEPEKLRGYLPYPTIFRDEPARGQRIMFPVQRPGGALERLVLSIEALERTELVPIPDTDGSFFELTVRRRLAYKGEETPIEVLRAVPLWIEAPAPLLRFQSARGEEVMVLAPGEEARTRALLAAQGAFVCPSCGTVDLHKQACARCAWDVL